MSGRPPCPYKTLGVARDASADEIKRAFTALALALHPDTSAAPSAQAAEKFARAKEAFDALRDPARLQDLLEANPALIGLLKSRLGGGGGGDGAPGG